MAHFDLSAREVLAKVVYYGPPLAGKTTNLQVIYDSVPADQKGPLFPLATATGQTIFFDLMPPGLGPVHGMKLRCELCTVDGPVSTQATLRAVLRDADAVVFVADSQEAAMDHNLACLGSLEQVLLDQRPSTPLVLQYNKRDLPTALPVQVLGELLNRRGVPAFQAIARQNVGVGEALRVVLRRLVNSLATLDPAHASKPPARRATARLAAADLPAGATQQADTPRPTRHATQRSQARGSLTLDDRHLTIPAMPREEFLEAARRHDTVPASPQEFFGRARDRYATLPAAPRETFGRAPEPRGTQSNPNRLEAPSALPTQGDEQTRPLRLSTEQSLAKGSLDASRPRASRQDEPAADAGPVAPPPQAARPTGAEQGSEPAAELGSKLAGRPTREPKR
jgi:hypothetical protein